MPGQDIIAKGDIFVGNCHIVQMTSGCEKMTGSRYAEIPDAEEDMVNEVVIKSNRHGVNLVLNEQMPFPELLQVIGDKFREAGSFFKDAVMTVAYEGRKLTEDEALQVAKAIMENSAIQVSSIMERGSEQEKMMRHRTEAADRHKNSRRDVERENYVPEGTGDFYKGNLRSGQILESASNITLIGDVNPGAKIISQGNIVILGALKGNAYAGAAGDNNCFVFALDMRPIQVQIGEYIAKSPDREKESKRLFKKEKEPVYGFASQIAVVRNGNICIEPMTKGCLDNL